MVIVGYINPIIQFKQNSDVKQQFKWKRIVFSIADYTMSDSFVDMFVVC